MIDQISPGVEKTICYLDDILVTGSNEIEHLKNLKEVLKCLHNHKVKVCLDKCKFMQKIV